jgi:hypothetical protein
MMTVKLGDIQATVTFFNNGDVGVVSDKWLTANDLKQLHKILNERAAALTPPYHWLGAAAE